MTKHIAKSVFPLVLFSAVLIAAAFRSPDAAAVRGD